MQLPTREENKWEHSRISPVPCSVFPVPKSSGVPIPSLCAHFQFLVAPFHLFFLPPHLAFLLGTIWTHPPLWHLPPITLEHSVPHSFRSPCSIFFSFSLFLWLLLAIASNGTSFPGYLVRHYLCPTNFPRAGVFGQEIARG